MDICCILINVQFVDTLLTTLENLALKVPLELFSFVGAFIEEFIAPIPSPFVMTLVGSITEAQDRALWYIFVVALIGALGKTIGAIGLYFITDKTEDLLLTKFGKFFGVSHDTIEKLGKYFGKGRKDIVVLGVIRSIPVMPSSPISILCGFLKIDFKDFVIATFFGTVIRNLFYIYLGYTGLASSQEVTSGIDSFETIGKLLFLGAIGAALIFAYKKREKILDDNKK